MNTPPTSSFSWPTFILALFGALAWLPVVYTLIQKRLSKTRINIYPDQLLHIVENEYNVILNLRIGIRTKVKEAFIENMTLVTEHSNGDTRHFKWAQLIENLTQTTINDNVMPTSKILNAIGYNLVKDTYTEPFVSFTNPSFRKKYEDLGNQLRIKSFYIAQNKQDKKQIEVFDPYIEMCNAYKKYYTWPSGDYSATLTIHTSDKQTFNKAFTFHIDEPNAETFKELNIAMVLDKLKNLFAREDHEKVNYDNKLLDGGLPFKITIV